MATHRAILPLYNSTVTTFESDVWSLADNVICRYITEADQSALWSFLSEGDEPRDPALVTPSTYCVYLNDLSGLNPYSEISRATLRDYATVVQSVLNMFCQDHPAVMPVAVVIDSEASGLSCNQSGSVPPICVVDLAPVENIHVLRTRSFHLSESASPDKLYYLFGLVHSVAERYPQVLVTLSRFNSSLVRATEADRIIDLTISLESLLAATAELNFRFTTILSHLAYGDVAERLATYALLRDLYIVRSGIVHGSSEDHSRQLERLRGAWPDLMHIARAVISYYLSYLWLYLNEKVSCTWKDHVTGLLLGSESRIFD